MGSIFRYDSPFFQFMNRLVDMIVLSLLWTICSIPIITIGAATTALYTVTLKMAKDQESYIIKSYFKAFKDNFLQSTIIWLIELVVGCVLFFGLNFWFTYGSAMGNVLGFIMTVVTVIYCLILLYSFPLLSKFDNSIKQTLKNSLLISLVNIKNTLMILIFTGISVAILYFVKGGFLLFILFGFSFLAYVNSFFFNKVFKFYIPEDKDDDNIDSIND